MKPNRYYINLNTFKNAREKEKWNNVFLSQTVKILFNKLFRVAFADDTNVTSKCKDLNTLADTKNID